LLTEATATNRRYAALTGLVTLSLVLARLSPLPLLALGACLGASGWLF